MKKQILNIGKALDKKEQKQISGGALKDPFGGTGNCDDYPYEQSNECEIDDDCGLVTDPLSGALFTSQCRVNTCGTYCFYSLT